MLCDLQFECQRCDKSLIWHPANARRNLQMAWSVSNRKSKALSKHDYQWLPYAMRYQLLANNCVKMSMMKWIEITIIQYTDSNFQLPQFRCVYHKRHIIHNWNVNKFFGIQDNVYNGIDILWSSTRTEWWRWTLKMKNCIKMNSHGNGISEKFRSYRQICVQIIIFVKFNQYRAGGVDICTVFLWPRWWNDSTFYAHVPIDVEHLWKIVYKTRAICYQYTELFHLRQCTPIHVCTTNIPINARELLLIIYHWIANFRSHCVLHMLLIDDPKFRMKYTTSQ